MLGDCFEIFGFIFYFLACKANRLIDDLCYSDGDFSISVTLEISKDEHEKPASVDNIIYPLVRWSLSFCEEFYEVI